MLTSRITEETGLQVCTFDFPQYEESFFGAMVGRFLKVDFGNLDRVDPNLAATMVGELHLRYKEDFLKFMEEMEYGVFGLPREDLYLHVPGEKVRNG